LQYQPPSIMKSTDPAGTPVVAVSAVRWPDTDGFTLDVTPTVAVAAAVAAVDTGRADA